jgi:hypothetical protein
MLALQPFIQHIILDLCEAYLSFFDQLLNDCDCQSVGYAVSNGEIALKFAPQLVPLAHRATPALALMPVKHGCSGRFHKITILTEPWQFRLGRAFAT